jgi:hypothetical protein
MKILLFVVSTLVYLALSPAVQAIVPPPDGGYPNFTTAEGDHALQALTTGVANTAIGTFSLFSVTTGNFNTAVGAGSLDLNQADSNTATGAAALLLNTTGTQNTAVGAAALEFNDSGFNNTANGTFALYLNTTGGENTANGVQALQSNTTGFDNTANGLNALQSNSDGSFNTANGINALLSNTTGDFNTANGVSTLLNNTTGSDNTAMGHGAGNSLTTDDGNVCIGSGVSGEAGAGNTTWIRNVNTLAQPIIAGIDGVTVRLSDGRLGHGVSSRRYKQDIQPMDRTSEALYGLKPVTFHYKKEIDPSQSLDFGLIAEEVAQANPELAVRDREGKISNYRRDAINAMLLNEFLKQHKAFVEEQHKVRDQGATIARLEEQVAALTAGLQKVSAQLELNKAAPQTVLNDQ